MNARTLHASLIVLAGAVALSGCDGENRIEIIGFPTRTATAARTATRPPASATATLPAPTNSPLPSATFTATRAPTATATRGTAPTTAPASTATPTLTRTLAATATSAATSTTVATPTSTATSPPTSTATTSGLTEPPTATFSPTATLTPGNGPPTATPTTTVNSCDVNGLLEPGETCESCAADCTVQPCAAATPLRTFRVDLVPPPFQDPSSVTVLLGYRDHLISLPGSGTAPAARVRLRPSGATVTPNDLDYALRVVMSRAGGLPAGRLFVVDFDSCGGAAAPTTADLACTVTGCSNSSGPISGCTCTVLNP